jgi:hypothetical protein
MLSGKGLFEGPNPASTVEARVKDDAFVQGRLALLAFPPDVARVLMNGLRSEPRARTQSPSELYELLGRALKGAGLQAGGPHSGEVPVLGPPRPKLDSITLEVPAGETPGVMVDPPEERVPAHGRHARIVETHERLDLAMSSDEGHPVRFRLTFLPGAGAQFHVNLKGLNCFVVRSGSTPTPAVVIAGGSDGYAELVSPRREPLCKVAWNFGNLRADARVFSTQGGELVVAFPRGMVALALDLGPGRDLIVVCRRL